MVSRLFFVSSRRRHTRCALVTGVQTCALPILPSLFDPVQLGALTAPNRILMAPLTRGRATRDHVPTPIMAEYYAQRARAGLIISEATGISSVGLGWPYAPGLWSEEKAAHWAPTTPAAHDGGGRIFGQPWHFGRYVHPDLHLR